MPQLNLGTVSDETQTRIMAAYGVATALEAKNAIISQIKQRVSTYEAELVANVERVKVKAALDAETLAVQQAASNAESQIVFS